MAPELSNRTFPSLPARSRRAPALVVLTGLPLLLAACGSGAGRAQATPSAAVANPATSLSALKAALAADAARLRAVEGQMKDAAGALGGFAASGPARTWSRPGVYRWSVPAGARFVEIEAIGGSGGGGNAGWVRAAGDGTAYTCEYEHDCFGEGGGGGGASAVTAGGTLLTVAPGGGGGGGGVRHHIGGGGGGSGGGGAEARRVTLSVVPDRAAWAACRTRCLYVGETLTITVGAGGGGAVRGLPGKGGFGYGGPGGTGGARCGANGGPGGRYGGGGGGGAACAWNLPGGAGGTGAYGGGGGAGAQGGLSCTNTGGAGGGFVGEGASPGAWTLPYGESGRCGGGRGGAARDPLPVWAGAGTMRGGRGVDERPSAPAGTNGEVVIVY